MITSFDSEYKAFKERTKKWLKMAYYNIKFNILYCCSLYKWALQSTFNIIISWELFLMASNPQDNTHKNLFNNSQNPNPN